MVEEQPSTPASAEPASTRIVVERPPPGLGRGQYAWPPWAIGLTGASVVLLGLGYLFWRVRRAGRR